MIRGERPDRMVGDKENCRPRPSKLSIDTGTNQGAAGMRELTFVVRGASADIVSSRRTLRPDVLGETPCEIQGNP
jgi:hypothetical protein